MLGLNLWIQYFLRLIPLWFALGYFWLVVAAYYWYRRNAQVILAAIVVAILGGLAYLSPEIAMSQATEQWVTPQGVFGRQPVSDAVIAQPSPPSLDPQFSVRSPTWSFLPTARYQAAQAFLQWKPPAHTTNPVLPTLQRLPRYGGIGWLAGTVMVVWVLYTRTRFIYICGFLLMGCLLEFSPPRPDAPSFPAHPTTNDNGALPPTTHTP